MGSLEVLKSPEAIRGLLGLGYTPSADQTKIIGHNIKEPLLVIAGAGSGKTETMANLIFNIILEHGFEILPDQILGMTFTNKAVSELSLRIRRGLKRLSKPSGHSIPRGVLPKISTYNAFAGQIVSEYGVYSGINTTARLITDADRILLASEAAANIATLDLLENDEVVKQWATNYEDENDKDNKGVAAIKLNSLATSALSLANDIANNLVNIDELIDYVLSEYHSILEKKDWGKRGGSQTRGKDYKNELLKLCGREVKRHIGIGVQPIDVASTLAHKYLLLLIVKEFNRLKTNQNVLDFGDQTYLAYQTLQQSAGIREKYTSQYKVVILDEYQDTSVAQVRLLQAVFGEHHPLIAVGDPNQAIYEWRGASSAGINNFVNDFTPNDKDFSQKLNLMTSYRNDNAILDVANTVSAKIACEDENQQVPPLTPRRGSGAGHVEVALCPTEVPRSGKISFNAETDQRAKDAQKKYLGSNEPSEVETVTAFLEQHFLKYNINVTKSQTEFADDNDIQTKLSEQPKKKRTAAILARARSDFNRYRIALESAGIPVQVVGLSGLLELPEIQDILAFLYVLNDKTANDKMLRLLTSPRVNLDAKILRILSTNTPKFKNESGETDHSKAWTLVERVQLLGSNLSVFAMSEEATESRFSPENVQKYRENIKQKLLNSGYQQQYYALQSLADILNEMAICAATYDGASLISKVITLSEIDTELRVIGNVNGIPDHLSSLSIDAFLENSNDYFHHHNLADLTSFLNYLEIADDAERGLEQKVGYVNPDAVQILTIHSAKGLEWDVVCCVSNTLSQYFKMTSNKIRTKEGGLLTKYPEIDTPADSMWFKSAKTLPDKFKLDLDKNKGILTFENIDSLAKFDFCLSNYKKMQQTASLNASRRLAYVAFTRAKSHLLVSASLYPRDAKDPTLPTPFFLDALENATKHNLKSLFGSKYPHEKNKRVENLVNCLTTLFPDENSVPALDKLKITGVWPNYSVEYAQNKYWQACSAIVQNISTATTISLSDIAAFDEDLSLLLTEQAGKPKTIEELAAKYDLPKHLSTSDLVRLAEDELAFRKSLLRPMPEKPTFVNDVGTRFHNWAQLFYTTNAVDEHINGNFHYQSDSLNDLLTIDKLVDKFLQSKWSKLLPLEVELELPILKHFAHSSHEIISKIDAIFEVDGKVLIVDWKTGRAPTGLADKVHKSIQLAEYRDAYLQYNTKVSPDLVEAAFVYVRDNHVNDANVWHFTASELEQNLQTVINRL